MLVIISVIIILIQISNLSKYYPVDTTSLLQGWRVEATTPAQLCVRVRMVGILVRVLLPRPDCQLHQCPSPTVIFMPVLSLEIVSHDLHFPSRFDLDGSHWFHPCNGQTVPPFCKVSVKNS